MASQFDVSAGHISRVVKRETGATYKDYVTKLRIEYAKKLLEDKSMLLGDVSVKVGYANIAHFIKVFKA